MSQRSIPASIYRGGTSRGVFFDERVLPSTRAERDRIFVEIMGSGHPLQVDGLGGTFSSNSKVMVVRPGDDAGIDVEYEFAQLKIAEPEVTYEGNCGNLTAAVATFAIDEGLVEVASTEQSEALVTMRNINTGVKITARVPLVNGRAKVQGETVIPGFNRSGAGIMTTFHDPGGSVYGTALPTGTATDVIDVGGRGIETSIIDITSPVIFIDADSVGLTAREHPATVNTNENLLSKIETIREACAAYVESVGGHRPLEPTPAQPKIAICSAPGPGQPPNVLQSRIFSMGRMHHAYTATGLMCAAAAMRIDGSVPQRLVSGGDEQCLLDHPGGTTEIMVEMDDRQDGPLVTSVTLARTARLIMRGLMYVRTTNEPWPSSDGD